MDLSERIARRQHTSASGALITDESGLNPAVHLPEPIGRGPILEQLLDALNPVFNGYVPDDIAINGPSGAGKSAIVTSLFTHLEESFVGQTDVIRTTTRGAPRTPNARFVYVNARQIDSEFQLFHALLEAISDESVPRRGVGTDELRERLVSTVNRWEIVLICVDHVGEESITYEEITKVLTPVERSIGLVVVGEEPPQDWDGQRIDVPAYRPHSLADILTERASRGMASGSVSHGLARRIADWADGDAHDALAALFGAAIIAQREGNERLTPSDVEAGIDAVPQECIQIGRVLVLPENRRTVLLELLDVGYDSITISEAAKAVGGAIDLSPNTVQRFIYEMAEEGILERTVVQQKTTNGRQPTAVVPRFPTLVFRRLEERSRR